jgi:hypothetical protein
MLQKGRKIFNFFGEIKSPGYYTSPGLSVRLVLQQVQKPKSLSNLRKPLRLQQAIFVFCLLLAISVSSKTSTTFDSRSSPFLFILWRWRDSNPRDNSDNLCVINTNLL